MSALAFTGSHWTARQIQGIAVGAGGQSPCYLITFSISADPQLNLQLHYKNVKLSISVVHDSCFREDLKKASPDKKGDKLT